jgi:hypothetical protein
MRPAPPSARQNLRNRHPVPRVDGGPSTYRQALQENIRSGSNPMVQVKRPGYRCFESADGLQSNPRPWLRTIAAPARGRLSRGSLRSSQWSAAGSPPPFRGSPDCPVSPGGQIETACQGIWGDSVILIVDPPSHVRVAAVQAVAAASGSVSNVSYMPLPAIAEMDEALRLSPNYRPSGGQVRITARSRAGRADPGPRPARCPFTAAATLRKPVAGNRHHHTVRRPGLRRRFPAGTENRPP